MKSIIISEHNEKSIYRNVLDNILSQLNYSKNTRGYNMCFTKDSFDKDGGGQDPLIYGFGKHKNYNTKNYLLAIRSDGEIALTDELLSTDTSKITFSGKNINSTTLAEIVNDPIFYELEQANMVPPEKCSKCCFYQVCGGGNLVSRYSEEKRFNNHSIYCAALQETYAHIANYLINSGIDKEIIKNNLFN